MQIAHWRLMCHKTVLNVLAVYRPPYSVKTGNTLPLFIDDFTEFITDFLSTNDNVIILGDFNIHVDDESDPDTQIFLDTMHVLGLQQHVHEQTHLRGHTLDLVFTEELSSFNVLSCHVGDYLSDHALVKCTISVKKIRPEQKEILTRKLKTVTPSQLRQIFDPGNIKDVTNFNTMVSQFEEELKRTLDQVAPLKSKKVSLHTRVPWFDDEVREKKLKTKHLESVWKKHQTTDNWQNYKYHRKLYVKLIREKKTQHLSEKVLECKGDTKSLYKLVANLTATVPENPMPPGKTDDELANEFAEFFINKIEKIKDALKDFTPYEHPDSNPPPFKFRELTEKEIRLLVTELNTKHCELDPIPTKLFKDLLPVTLPIITKIVNLSLLTGQFSRHWKVALVKPLLKKLGLELVASNYRPVSNLPFISKIVEKGMLYLFNDHLQKFDLLPDYQSAYRQGYSCETSLLRMHNDILWALEKRQGMAVAICDLSAAFDTVCHRTLLHVLERRYGVDESALKWFENYLQPRSLRVAVGNAVSSKQNLTVSVPQGSVAGAQIFTAYSATLDNVIPREMSLNGFADDHSIRKQLDLKDEKSICDTRTAIESTMVDIKEWMNQVRLKMNDSKTEFIVLGSKPLMKKLNWSIINVNGIDIHRSRVVRLLGAWLDQNLSMQEHIKMKARKASLNLQRIKKIRQYLTIDATKTLIQSLVMSHLDYANSLLAGLPWKTIQILQKVQNLAAKIVLREHKYTSNSEALRKLHWLPIQTRIKFKIITIVHKCLYGVAPLYLKELIKSTRVNRTGLRSSSDSDKLEVPRSFRRTFADRSFSIQGPELWNKLPRNLRQITDFNDFKSKLKTFLFDKPNF